MLFCPYKGLKCYKPNLEFFKHRQFSSDSQTKGLENDGYNENDIDLKEINTTTSNINQHEETYEVRPQQLNFYMNVELKIKRNIFTTLPATS